ncbi:photosystem II repair protein Psb32 [Synechococcus elongatus]|uniref:TPM domain-containing protein n=1 Tax=Synechococcus elongatus PCC 11801 TaxID=2219813 RepID=A0AAN1QR23_SYNEL|nr:TPM domain-containing protein [Synechococcus elongatus]
MTSVWARCTKLLKVFLCTGIAIVGLVLPSAPAWATGAVDLPLVPAGSRTWIVDEAQSLSRINEGQLSGELQPLAEKTGIEVRFVTLRRLDYGETIDSFVSQLFQRWYPSAEQQSNQVLIALDTITNTIGIQVGEAAAEQLTPAIASSVIDETMQLPIRQGNKYNQAILDASDRLVAVLSGEPDPGPPVVIDTTRVEGTFASAEETEESRGNSTVVVIVLLVLATVIPMATYYWYVR